VPGAGSDRGAGWRRADAGLYHDAPHATRRLVPGPNGHLSSGLSPAVRFPPTSEERAA